MLKERKQRFPQLPLLEDVVDDEFLETPELSRLIKVPVPTLHQWRNKKLGPPAFRVGRKLLYRRSAVERWLREQEEADRLTPLRGGAA